MGVQGVNVNIKGVSVGVQGVGTSVQGICMGVQCVRVGIKAGHSRWPGGPMCVSEWSVKVSRRSVKVSVFQCRSPGSP